ncbi:MAG: zinc ribbon domain-containing protein [Anaerolineae bacterium]
MAKNSQPERLECPGCGSSSFTASPDGSLVCDYCHTAYVLPGRACPVCGAVYEPDARHCPACGADLVRECPACGTPNPAVARKCAACGQEMEILESLFARVTGTRAGWLREIREEAPAIKAQQEATSRARLADMWAADARRREALARAQAERDRQQRIMWNVALVVLIIVVVLIILAIVISRIQSPYFYLP